MNPDRLATIENALFYHRYPRPGKLEIQATKPLGNQRDLALAYSPGVAAPCLAIRDNPDAAAAYTARANLVAVVSNGTAVLGLGNIGPLASKPVMEGKAVLFKKFAGIDVFDIEIDAPDVDRMVERSSRRWSRPSAASISRTSRRPNASRSKQQLREIMNIPVFHDDQHGTAIIVAACILNGLELAGKKIEDAKIVTSAQARRRLPASTCWWRSAPNARTSGSPTSMASSTKAAK
jgi:malate dehydrogenase (oxaloacetate-decarboxylating)(NADP+)